MSPRFTHAVTRAIAEYSSSGACVVRATKRSMATESPAMNANVAPQLQAAVKPGSLAAFGSVVAAFATALSASVTDVGKRLSIGEGTRVNSSRHSATRSFDASHAPAAAT